jgi:hypothetical protein
VPDNAETALFERQVVREMRKQNDSPQVHGFATRIGLGLGKGFQVICQDAKRNPPALRPLRP